MKRHPSKMEGFFISAISSFLPKRFTVKHPGLYCQSGSKLGITHIKNQKMKNYKSFIETNIKPWHLLAGIYGCIIVAGVTYRILNA